MDDAIDRLQNVVRADLTAPNGASRHRRWIGRRIKPTAQLTSVDGATTVGPDKNFPPIERDGTTSFRDEVRLLGVGGLVLFLILVVGGRLGLETHGSKFALYLTLGTVFPALLVMLEAARRLGRPGRAAWWVVALGLASFGVGNVLAFLAGRFDSSLLILALLSATVLFVARGMRIEPASGTVTWALHDRPRNHAGGWSGLSLSLVVLLILTVSWIVSVRLLFWTDFEAWITTSLDRVFILLGALVLVAWNLGAVTTTEPRPRSRPRWMIVADVAAIVLFALASLRVDTLGAPSPVDRDDLGLFRFHHWGAAVGPAELLRQGGWLLWDVPSTYGFLSTLAIAWLPTRSVWQSYYILHALTLTLSASMLFVALRALRSGRSNYVFALLATFSVVFLIPGIPWHLTGPSVHPPLSAFRYVGCYALLAVLIWEYRGAFPGRMYRGTPIVGGFVLTLAMLWSPESAIYGLAMWVPSYGVMAWRRALHAHPGAGRWRARAVSWLLWWAVPLAMVATALAVIAAFYQVRLGHGPDWARFLDYCATFSGEAYAIQQQHSPDGAIWVLLLVFAALSTFAAATLGRRASCATMALAAGLWGMLWATSGYYVIRAFDNFLLCLGPILVLCLVIAFRVMERDRMGPRLALPIRAALIPILTVWVTMGFGNIERLGDWGHALKRGYISKVDRLMPPAEPELVRLLERANVGRDEPIVYLDPPMNVFPLRPATTRAAGAEVRWRNRSWLPTLPYVPFYHLPPKTARIYLSRFVTQSPQDGWLIEAKSLNAPIAYAWLFDEIAQTHDPVATFEDGDWKLTRYVLRDQQTALASEHSIRR